MVQTRKSRKMRSDSAERRAIERAIYLLRVAAFSDIVNEEATAQFDDTTCDGACFKEDAKDAIADLEARFAPLKMPADAYWDMDS